MQSDALQQILMTASRERSERTVLRIIVEGLAEQPDVALARIWLLRPGDICGICRMRPECPDQLRCLHLAASSGRSLAEPGADWTRIDGDFRRFPVGVRKVGQIAATGIPMFVADTAEQSEWIARPQWATSEHIRSFAGQPLVFASETLGVIAVFSRVELGELDFRWLRLFADHSAITLVNVRAFEEIERLKRRLELENEYLREEISQSQAFGDIVGSSPALKMVLEQIDLVASTNANVLILGESGTGKELVARAIHERSQRRHRPLVKVNCASIPKELFESEFFGHAKARSRERCVTGSADSNWPTAGRSSSTRSEKSRWTCRASCCGCCRNGNSSAWARRHRDASMCASSPPQIATWRPSPAPAASARISTTAWASFRSRYHLFGTEPLTLARWPRTLCGASVSNSSSLGEN